MSGSKTNEPCPQCGSVYGPALLHAPECPGRIGFHGAPTEWGPGRFNEVRTDKAGRRWRYCHTWEPVMGVEDA